MAGRRNTGLAALIEVSRLTRAPTATDLGWALGPRINAGGRVGRSDLGVRLLTTEEPEEAREIAAELERLNEDRKSVVEGKSVSVRVDLDWRCLSKTKKHRATRLKRE